MADREVVLVAVAQVGYALRYASAELKADREVVLVAGSGGAERLGTAVRVSGAEGRSRGGTGSGGAERRRTGARVGVGAEVCMFPGMSAPPPRGDGVSRCRLPHGAVAAATAPATVDRRARDGAATS
jgi:hypothetical protein